MRQAGQASWQMSIDEPQNLVLGLFIRDVAALSSAHSWLPPAAPAVPGVAGGGGLQLRLGSGTRGGTTPLPSIRTLLGRR